MLASEVSVEADLPDRRPEVGGAGSMEVYTLVRDENRSAPKEREDGVPVLGFLELVASLLAFLRVVPFDLVQRDLAGLPDGTVGVVNVLLQNWD